MSPGEAECRQKSPGADNIPSQIRKQRFRTVDLSHVVAKTDGRQIDLDARSSADPDLKAEFLNGRVKVLTVTDCSEWNCKEDGNRASYFYNAHRGI